MNGDICMAAATAQRPCKVHCLPSLGVVYMDSEMQANIDELAELLASDFQLEFEGF